MLLFVQVMSEAEPGERFCSQIAKQVREINVFRLVSLLNLDTLAGAQVGFRS